MTITGIVAAVVIVGAGTAIAARNAGPGDALYGLRASLYGEADTDVQAHFDAAQTAYDEAERMDDDGTLSASERARLTAEYSLHVNALADRIADLEAEGDVSAAADLRVRLRDALRRYRSVFPIEIDLDDDDSDSSVSSMSSDSDSSVSSMSSDDDDDDEASSSSMMNSSSSIFIQPSSSVTSA